jgi:hypothetical protein
MKNRIIVLIFSVLAIVVTANRTYAQSGIGENYFIGKWEILAKDLPQGDLKLNILIENKDGKLAGSINDPSTPEGKFEFTSITSSDSTFTGKYF